MKRFLALALSLVMLIAVSGCQSGGQSAAQQSPASAAESASQQPSTDSNATAGKKIRIGLSWFTMSEEHLANIYNEMEAYIKESGQADNVELILLDAGMDALKQNSQVDNLISQKVDVIIMIPFDKEQQVPAVKAAKAANIPLIELCASTSAEDDRTTYVGSEDIASGRILMEELAKVSGGKGNIVIIHGPAGQNAEIMRHTGAQEVLEKYPDMQITAEKICDWDRAKAMSAMENILQSNIAVDIVFAEDDGMAMGALEAIEGSGREGIIIGGIDGIPDALQAVKDGRLACTVYQNAKEQGITAFEVAKLLADNQPVEPIYDVPYELITKDNVDSYMEH